MKISCQTCQAKYTIADEKVAGKVVKIKCKKCGSTIVVNGNDPSAAPPDAHGHAPVGGGEDEDGETRIFMDPPAGGAAPSPSVGGGDEWTVNVTDDDQRTMTSAVIATEIMKGVVTRDTYVWKDGMADWLPVVEVPELASFLGAAPAASPAPAPAMAGGGGLALGGTMMMEQSPVAVSPLAAARPAAAASPAGAARRAGARPGNVDLFGGSSQSAAEAAPPAPAGDKHTGERNENSVLFSLSALTATENAAKASSKKDDAVLDLSPSKPRNGGRAGFDDIMNLGGGGIGGGMGASPALAPPPLLAPVVEAPPPQAAPAMQMAPGMSGGMPYSTPTPAKKSPVGIIIGGVIALALIAGVAVFALKGGGGTPPVASATPDAPAAQTAPAPVVQTAAPSAAPTAVAADTSTPAPAADASGSPSAAANAGTPGGKAPAGGNAPGSAPGSKTAAAAPPDTKAAAPSTPTPPPADTGTPAPAPAAGGNGEFNRGAASAALGAAAGGAKGCKKADGPTGSGRVKVTFAPSGNVTTAQVDGPPFAGTSVGGCIAGAFRGAHVPPFDGSSVTVTKSFSIN